MQMQIKRVEVLGKMQTVSLSPSLFCITFHLILTSAFFSRSKKSEKNKQTRADPAQCWETLNWSWSLFVLSYQSGLCKKTKVSALPIFSPVFLLFQFYRVHLFLSWSSSCMARGIAKTCSYQSLAGQSLQPESHLAIPSSFCMKWAARRAQGTHPTRAPLVFGKCGSCRAPWPWSDLCFGGLQWQDYGLKESHV